MTPEMLSLFGGAALSLFASYVPGFSPWFGKLTGTQKRGLLLLAMLAIAVVGVTLDCAGVFAAGYSCEERGVVGVLFDAGAVFLLALTANQATYAMTPD
jgi:hypothetical protein